MNEAMLHEIAIIPHLWIMPLAAVVVVIIGLLLWAWGASASDSGYYMDGEMRLVFGVVIASLGGLVALIWVFLLIPFHSKYHVFYSLEGEVTNVTRSFTDGSGELTYSPVVTMEGFDAPIVVEDSRIYDYLDDAVRLTCSLEFVPYGQDRVNCFIAG